MHPVKVVTAALCLFGLVSPASAIGLYCAALESVPPEVRQRPTVHYEVHTVPADVIGVKYCPRSDEEVVGCSYRAVQGWRWVIIISDAVSAEDYPCVVEYEKAHLPPNCWGDPEVETPDTIHAMATTCRH